MSHHEIHEFCCTSALLLIAHMLQFMFFAQSSFHPIDMNKNQTNSGGASLIHECMKHFLYCISFIHRCV